MQGWVKLHRQIMKSDTFARLNAIQQIITIYIILNANHEDGVWYDKYKDIEVPVKRGQLVTSRNKIANEWFKNDKEITERKVRTTLERLERYGFLTKQSTKGYTLLNIVNYGVYQSRENENVQQVDQGPTKQRPSNDQATTTNKNVKNDKNEKKNTSRSKLKFETCHFQLAERLYNNILDNNPNHKKPNLESWANDVRLMMERDNRTEEQIRYLIDWVQKDEFEMTNVLSTKKLRERFDNLVMKVKREKGSQPKRDEYKSNSVDSTEFLKELGGD